MYIYIQHIITIIINIIIIIIIMSLSLYIYIYIHIHIYIYTFTCRAWWRHCSRMMRFRVLFSCASSAEMSIIAWVLCFL